MTDKQITQDEKESAKDKMLKEVVEQLTKGLVFLKDSLGQKKFDKRIRKAGKLLIDGIKPATEKKPAAKAALPKATKTSEAKTKSAPAKKKISKSPASK